VRREWEYGYDIKTSESWRGDAGSMFAFSILVKMRTGHRRSGKLTPRRGIRGGIPGNRKIKRYAIAKCPMNMTGEYAWIVINGSVNRERVTIHSLTCVIGRNTAGRCCRDSDTPDIFGLAGVASGPGK
jgi:hypothetical protein